MKTHLVAQLTLFTLLILAFALPAAAQGPAPYGPATQPPVPVDAAPPSPDATPQKAPDGRWFMPFVRRPALTLADVDALPITLAYSPGTSSAHVDRTLRRAEAWSAWLTEHVGPAPYGRVDIDAVGIVGGATKVHPTAQLALKIRGVTTAVEG